MIKDTGGPDDIIRFGAGIDLSDLVFTPTGTSDLKISIVGTSDSLTLSGFHDNLGIEGIVFNDNSSVSLSETTSAGLVARYAPATLLVRRSIRLKNSPYRPSPS